MKEKIKVYWYMNRYKLLSIRRFTYEIANNTTKFSYDEFYEMSGITVEEYDDNVELYQNMRYEDIKAYLSNKQEVENNNNIE